MQMFENGSPPKMSTVSRTSSASADPTNSTESDGTPKDGSLDHGPSSAKYVGSTHWSAIMENIQELKSAMVDEAARRGGAGEADEDEIADHEILFGAKTAMSLSQILAQHLPQRIVVDRLLATYFNAKYMVVPFIHTYQFQRQYEQFWRDQLSMPPLWVSILFSICCLATQLNQVLGGDGPGQGTSTSPSTSFIVASAQCLILGGYVYPKPHVVEALGLYSQCKYTTSLDPSREVGIIFAILVRLAFRMAYHRDADNFTHFSVFEGEMRRRAWTMCLQFDKMVSFQLGLPNNIPPDSWDTKTPRNLLDSDFSEDISVLPPSRPEHEPTQILYFIVKARLMANFGQVCNHALSFRKSSEAEIMELDADIRETYSQVPYALRIRPMAQSLADPPYLLMVRLNCEFLYQKSLLVLHRKYMTQGFERSTKTCLAAAMSIIECFADIHKEFRPGGALYNNRWMLTSFTMNDFLLAAMVLCLSLSQWRRKNPGRSIDEDALVTQQVEMLRACHEICRERAPTSVESRKVADALRAMLAQIDPQGPASERSETVVGTDPSNNISRYGQNQKNSRSNPDAVNLTPLTLAETPTPQTGSDPLFSAPLGPFYSFIEGTEDIDWTYLDQYLVYPNRYDDDAMQGVEGQPMGFDGSQDWNSEPYRFLGQGPRPSANHQPHFGPSTDSVGTNGHSQHGFGNNPPMY
jgi:Fungal specific transcription factor domain